MIYIVKWTDSDKAWPDALDVPCAEYGAAVRTARKMRGPQRVRIVDDAGAVLFDSEPPAELPIRKRTGFQV